MTWVFCFSSSPQKKTPDSAVIRLIITQQKKGLKQEKRLVYRSPTVSDLQSHFTTKARRRLNGHKCETHLSFFFFFFSYSRQKHNCTREERGTCPFTNTTPGLTMGDRLPLPALAGTLLLVVLGLLTLLPHSILGKPAEEEEEAANAGSSALLQRVKRGWVWNQFFVLEEYTGLEPLYIGKVSDVLYEHTHTHTHTREVMTWRNVTRAGLQAWSGSSSSDWPFSPVFGVFTSCTQGKV